MGLIVTKFSPFSKIPVECFTCPLVCHTAKQSKNISFCYPHCTCSKQINATIFLPSLKCQSYGICQQLGIGHSSPFSYLTHLKKVFTEKEMSEGIPSVNVCAIDIDRHLELF
jgi:hypothetical protein